MGNRAIITTQKEWCRDGYGIYIHWNGGRDSVEAFCKYCELREFRTPESDSSYAMARLVQIIGNFFCGGLSVGLVPARCGAGDDNGVYMIGGNWEIVRHIDCDGSEWKWGEQRNYDLVEMLVEIDKTQPIGEQIGEEEIMELMGKGGE